MASDILKRLHGDGSHVDPSSVFEGLDWKMAGQKPIDCPHSILQLLNHMIYWQDFILEYLRGQHPGEPEHAKDSWPGKIAPRNESEWDDTVSRFTTGLKAAEKEAAQGLNEDFDEMGSDREDILNTLIEHNSYHTGQVALIRRMIGEWPPPNGGDTW